MFISDDKLFVCGKWPFFGWHSNYIRKKGKFSLLKVILFDSKKKIIDYFFSIINCTIWISYFFYPCIGSVVDDKKCLMISLLDPDVCTISKKKDVFDTIRREVIVTQGYPNDYILSPWLVLVPTNTQRCPGVALLF